MPAIKPPVGWSIVTKWPFKRSPTFQKMTIPGWMWIYRTGDSWSLEIQGHRGSITEGPLETVVHVANEWDTAHNLRVCDMDSDEWAQEFYGRSLIAFNALADGDSASIEQARDQIGKMEAFLHDLRGRLQNKEEKETYASRAERRSVEMKLAIHELYTWLLFGKQDAANATIETMEALLRKMKLEIIAEKSANKQTAS